MKKYFKLGTTLAFSVLLNLTPILIPSVHAEEVKEENPIVEEINKNEVYYAEQFTFDESSIPEEEPLEVKSAANEVSTAEENNIITSEPARAPTTTVNEAKIDEVPVVKASETNTVTLHIMNTLNGVESPEEITSVTVTNPSWLSKTLTSLRLSLTTTKDGDPYLFQGWFTAPSGGEKIQGSKSAPVEYENARLYTMSSGTVYYQVKEEVNSNEDIYIYAQWKQGLKTKLHIMNTLSGEENPEQIVEIDIVEFAQKSKRLADLGLATSMTHEGKDYAFQGWFTAPNGGTLLPTTSATAIGTENITLWANTSGTIYYKGLDNPSYVAEDIYVYAQWKEKHYTTVHGIDMHTGEEQESSTKSPITTRRVDVAIENIIDAPIEYKVRGGGTKYIQIIDDDYIYTFKGWYYINKETGEKVYFQHRQYVEFNGVKIYTNSPEGTSPGVVHIENTTSGTPDLLEDEDIKIYADWEREENPNVKVKVNIINTITNEKETELTVQSNENISKTLTALVNEITGIGNDKYHDNEHVYSFDGFYTEDGIKVTEEGINLNNLSIKYEVLETIIQNEGEEVHLYSDALRFIASEELQKGTINLYVRWTTNDLPKIELIDVKPNNTELASTFSVGGAGNVIGLDQIFTGQNRGGKYSGVRSSADKSETDSNHIYNFLGWYTEEEGGEQIGEDFTLTGDYARVFDRLSVNNGDSTAPFAITFNSSSSYQRKGNTIPNTIKLYGRWNMIVAPVLAYRQENNVTLEENESWVNSNGTTSTFTANLEALVETSGDHKFLYWKVYYDDPEMENYGNEYDHIDYAVTNAENSTFVYTFQNDLEHSGTEEKLVNRAWWQPALTVILYDTKPVRRSATQIGYKKDYENIILVGENGVLPQIPEKEGYTFVGWFVVETDEAYLSNEVIKPDSSYETPNEETGINVPKTVRLYAKWTKEIHVTKVWEDQNNVNQLRPTTVTIEVHASNQEEALEAFTLSGENDTWTSESITVEGFDDNGEEIIYTASEDNMDYYHPSVDGLVVTNTLKPEGTVYVEYYDLETNEQFENSRETLHGIIDTEYASTAKEFANYTLEVDRTEGETTGKFEENEKTVKYYYSLNSSKVITHYVDQKTNEEFEYSQEETEGKIGTSYETFEKHFTHYELVETPENATGVYAPETTHVYYFYTWKQGTVNIHHYDQNGETLIEFENLQDTISGDVDSPYTTEAAVIPHYHLIGDSGNITGTYTEEAITVNYYYEKNEGTVIVHHMDKDTNKEFIDYQTTLNGKVEASYETNFAEIPNYTLDEESLPTNQNGFYTEETIDVYYYYTINNGQVNVQYINLETNEEFEDSAETLEGKINSNYQTVEKTFENYTMVRVEGETTGTYQAEPVTVTYYYSLNNSNVIVHYIDQKTNEEFEYTQEELTGKIGSSYETIEKHFTHYELVETPENATGEYTPETTHVYYYYKWMKGVVNVHYYERKGEELVEFTNLQDTLTGDVDANYETNQLNIEHYHYVGDSGNVIGTYTEDTIIVNYYYEKNQGNVIVHHIDKDTNEEFVEYQTTTQKPVGEEYETSSVEIPNYTLDEETLPENATGIYAEEDTHVTYYYIMNNGQVIVKYVNSETGEEFENSQELLEGKINSSYETEEKSFENYTRTNIEGETTGTYQAEPITVTYYYSINDGKVIVHYVDKDTNEELENYQEILTGKINTNYETVQKEIPHYTFDGNSDNITGQYQAEDQDVTYYYVKNSGHVTVYYVDKNDTSIVLATEEFNDKVGTLFTIEEKEFDFYEWVDPKPEMERAIPDGKEEIYLYYEKHVGVVEVSYVDIMTGEEIADSEEYSGTIDQEYETIQKEIAGYRFVRSTGQLNGNFPDNRNEIVIYYYEAVGRVTVKYLEEGSEHELGDTVEKVGAIGGEYYTDALEFEGYQLKEMPTNFKGTYTKEAIEVVYYYHKMGEVKVYYVDKDNNSLIDDEYEIINGVVGNRYETVAKEFAGYQLFTVISDEDGNATSGEIAENAKKVTFIYEALPEEEKLGLITVIYKDEETGKEISPRSYLEGVIGDSYRITFKDIENYEYSKVEGPEVGTYQENGQEVIYYYTKKEVNEQNHCCNNCCNTCADTCDTCNNSCANYLVITRYEDEDGNTIADEVVEAIAENQQYATKKKVIDGYEFVMFSEDSDPTEGTYTISTEGEAQPIKVTYIYRAIPVEEPEVVEELKDIVILVKYLDRDTNNPVFDSVTITGKEKEAYTITRKAKEGYTLVAPEFDEIGEFSENLTLVYYYKKVEEPVVEETKLAYVVVKYMNEAKQEIAEKEILSGKIGEFYFTTQKMIDGYIFVEVDGEEEGQYSEEIKVITYSYEKEEEEKPEPEKENGILVVHYVDKNNNTIADDVVTTEIEGTKYVTSQKMIDGYTFVSKTDNYIGEYTNDIIEVTYTYQAVEEEMVVESKDITILVQYIDQETNNPVFDSVTLTGKEGNTYTITRKAKDGYNLINPEFDEIGIYQDNQVFVYYYEKVKEENTTVEQAYVLVHYIDSNGNQLRDDKLYTGNVGDTYAIPVPKIDGYNLVDIEKVEATPALRLMMFKAPVRATSKANIGTYTAGVTELNFLYEEEETEEPITPEEPKAAMLIVRYVDTKGAAVAEDTVTTGYEGDFYNASQKIITGYQFVSVDAEKTYGTLEAGQTVITYIYDKLPIEEPVEENNPSSEGNQPIINIDININNENNSDNHSENNNNNMNENNVENNSDNHSENNSETTVENNSDNHSENNVENNTTVDTHNDINNDNHTDVNNDTNVDNHNDNTTEVNNDNSTNVNNENNNQDESNVNIENNPTIDTNVEVNPVVNNNTDVSASPVVTTNTNIENNPTVSNDTNIENSPSNTNSNEGTIEDHSTSDHSINIENNPSNAVENSNEGNNENNPSNTNENANEGNNENNPINNNEGTNTNNNENNNPNSGTSTEEKPSVEPTTERGLVVVNYLDENDKVLASSVIKTGKVDEQYVTNAKEIPHYTFMRVEGNESGKYTDDVIVVNYYYQTEKDSPSIEPETKHGSVIAYYVDNTGEELDKVIIEEEVGTTYYTDQKSFEGYDFVNVYGARNGEIKEGITEIIYLYNKPIVCEDCPVVNPEDKETGKVIVHYVDKDNNPLLDDETLTGNVGDPYETASKDIKDYTLVETKGEEKGTYSLEDIEITYIYEKNRGTVIAHYLDQDTKAMIGYDIEQEGLIGDEYTTKLRKFRGYNFVQVVGAYAGRYTADTIEVTYYYRKAEQGGAEPIDENKTPAPTPVPNPSLPDTNNGYEIVVPNTGVSINYGMNLLAFILILLGAMGFVVSKSNE